MRAVLTGLFLALALANVTPALAQAPKAEEKVTLRAIMQELGVEYVRAANAVMLDDFKTLQEVGEAVAHHPLPDPIVAAIKRRLGKDFAAFEKVDERSHAAAISLSKQAVAKSTNGAAKAFGDLTAACVSCHTQFRAKLRPLSD